MENPTIFFNLNPVNFFILSGLTQNFILSGILFLKPGEASLSNRLLSLTIFIVNVHLTYLMVLDTNMDNIYPFLLWVPYSFLTAVGPLIFLYTKSLTNAEFGYSEINKKSFIPTFIEVLLQFIMIAQAITNNVQVYNTPMYFYLTPLMYLWTAGSIIYHLKVSIEIINNHENWALKNFSNMKDITLSWLRKLIQRYRLLWTIWIPFVIAFLLFFRFQLMYFTYVLALYSLMLFLTYLTLWIGIEGVGRRTMAFLRDKEIQAPGKNFARLQPEEIESYIQRITHLMNVDKLYLNENLSLRDLASSLRTDPNLVSFMLNNHFNSNFYDFINQFRVEEVKRRLNTPGNEHLSLLGIALDSGFNSKTTFNRVFKRVTELTPTEWVKTQKRAND